METKSLSMVCQQLGLEPGSKMYLEAYAYCLSYLTKGLPAFDFQRAIKPYLPSNTGFSKTLISAKMFRLSLIANKYYYFTLKLYVLQLNTILIKDEAAAQLLATQTGVSIDDANLIHNYWMISPNFRRRIKTWARTIPKSSSLSLKSLESGFCKRIYPKVLKYVKFITYSKLRFITKANNGDPADFHAELTIKALQTYYQIAPDERGDAFLINYINKAVHHHAMNLIQKNKTLKHGRLIEGGLDSAGNRTFSLLEISENQMICGQYPSSEGEDIDNSLQGKLICSNDPTLALENEISVSTLLLKYRTNPKKQRLLLILMGTSDEEFSIWLRSRKHCAVHEDNSDLQERIALDDFRKLVSQFLHVNDDSVNVFLTQLQAKMSEKTKRATKSKFNEQRTMPIRRQPEDTYAYSTYDNYKTASNERTSVRRRSDAN